MKVLVLGAGVVGTAAAYYLARDGHEVTVIEQATGKCVDNAEEVETPTYLCKGDGKWYLPAGGCKCKAGFEADVEKQTCNGEYLLSCDGRGPRPARPAALPTRRAHGARGGTAFQLGFKAKRGKGSHRDFFCVISGTSSLSICGRDRSIRSSSRDGIGYWEGGGRKLGLVTLVSRPIT